MMAWAMGHATQSIPFPERLDYRLREVYLYLLRYEQKTQPSHRVGLDNR